MEQPPNQFEPAATEVVAQLERVLKDPVFLGSQRSSRLLRHIVETALAGKAAQLKEYSLGIDVLERGTGFDPRTDPIVRSEISRLRARLDKYYAVEGAHDRLLIHLPKGGYVPEFRWRSEGSAPEAASIPPRRWHRSRLAVAAAIAVSAGLAVWLVMRGAAGGVTAAPPGAGSIAVRIDPGAPAELGSEVGNDFALSRDGTRMVFAARRDDGVTMLYSRLLSGLNAHELPGTQGARVPEFSPEGDRVAFWSNGELKKTRFDGAGPPESLGRAEDLLGISWTQADAAMATFTSETLVRIDMKDGRRTEVGHASADRLSRLIWPQWLPEINAVLYTAGSGQMSNSRAELLDLATGKSKTLMKEALYARLVGEYLLYVQAGTLYAVRFNTAGLAVQGEPMPLARDLSWSPVFGLAQYAATAEGLLIYRRDSSLGQMQPAWLDATGATQAIGMAPGYYQWPRLSPDGRQLAIARRDGANFDLWVRDLQSRRDRRIAAMPQDLFSPVWMPDGMTLVFGAGDQLRYVALDGSQSSALLEGDGEMGSLVPWSAAPDGSRLALFARGPDSAFDLWTVPLSRDASGLHAGKPELFLRTPAFEVHPSFSPDGRWIVYGSTESGQWEIYVRAFSDNGRRVQVSVNGGWLPAWGDASTIYYQTLDHRVMVSKVATQGQRFTAGAPQLWSSQYLSDLGFIANYDAGPGQKRGVWLQPASPGPSAGARPELIMLTDYRSLLRSKIELPR